METKRNDLTMFIGAQWFSIKRSFKKMLKTIYNYCGGSDRETMRSIYFGAGYFLLMFFISIIYSKIPTLF